METGTEAFVFGGILHRMILWELVKVFVMSLVGITGILLMAGIVAEASQQGLGPAQILTAIPLLIPSTLPYTIPATTLFATCVVYGRLAADNEILAIKSSGVNILQVARPGLILGLAMSGATWGLYYNVIPLSHLVLRQMVYNDAEELLYSMLRKQGSINLSQTPYALWVRGVEGRKLIAPVIKGRDAHNKTNFVAEAREAELRVDMFHRKLSIRMHNGTAMAADGANNVAFETETWDIDLPPSFGVEDENERRPRDLTWEQMWHRRQGLSDREAELQHQAEEASRDPSAGPEGVKRFQAEVDYCRQKIVWIDVELLMRPALSLGCLCFILVGCPVGIWFSRSDYLSAFIICFLPIVVIYYPLMLCGTGIAKEGHNNPVLLVWGANLLMGGVGAALFWRLLRN
jgi:lipopolysaccharide export system permease protein